MGKRSHRAALKRLGEEGYRKEQARRAKLGGNPQWINKGKKNRKQKSST